MIRTLLRLLLKVVPPIVVIGGSAWVVWTLYLTRPDAAREDFWPPIPVVSVVELSPHSHAITIEAYGTVVPARRRLRPIILTSLTTFIGLAPMIFETSVQSRFLVPMVISLGYGIFLSTAVVLVFTLAIHRIASDLHQVLTGTVAFARGHA